MAGVLRQGFFPPGEARATSISRSGAVTDEQRSHSPISAQPAGRQLFFPQTSLLTPYRSISGYARRSRLVCGKNFWPRKLTNLGDTTRGRRNFTQRSQRPLSKGQKGNL